MVLGDDIRAIHLESLLLQGKFGDSVTWRPRHLTLRSLETLYRRIIPILCTQFGWPTEGKRSPLGAFPEAPNEVRQGIHVMAEAVMAVWLETPIPQASHARSIGLAEIIGWWPERPGFDHELLPGGQVCYARPERQGLARCARVLRPASRAFLEQWIEGLPSTDSRYWRYINREYARSLGVEVFRH